MRSRYTAYALGCDEYVLATWAPETRPAVLFEEGDVRPKWRSLSVIEAPLPAEDADEGTVTFTAAGRTSAGAFRMTEKSRFRREAGRWFYVNGDVSED